MINKICLVTGANSGIGKATADGLLEEGATVVMLCRNKQRGLKAREELLSKHKNGNVDLIIADLSVQESIRHFVSVYKTKYDKLDVLINNAGVGYQKERKLTEDGIEITFAVNYLAPFLITNLLLGVLKKSAPARIVNVAGMMHDKVSIQLDDLNFENSYSPANVSSHSKLALIMFTYELARRLKGTGVTVNCLHPGAVRTSIQKGLPWYLNIMVSIVRLFFLSPKKGAKSVLHLAISPELDGVSGKYFNRLKELRSFDKSYDVKAAKKLWEKSAKLCGLEFGLK